LMTAKKTNLVTAIKTNLVTAEKTNLTPGSDSPTRGRGVDHEAHR
jgi:hypothetical protein